MTSKCQCAIAYADLAAKMYDKAGDFYFGKEGLRGVNELIAIANEALTPTEAEPYLSTPKGMSDCLPMNTLGVKYVTEMIDKEHLEREMPSADDIYDASMAWAFDLYAHAAKLFKEACQANT